MSRIIGVKLKQIVWSTKIYLPFLEVGLNVQIPLEISWIIELEMPDLFADADALWDAETNC